TKGDDVMRKILCIVIFLFSLSVVSAQTNRAQIIRFDADLLEVSRTDLVAGTVELPVRWEVINRSPTMNLVFEQILPDGSIINVELPRSNPWVNSNEVGLVAPVNPGNAVHEIQLQVRLYYFLTRQTINSATLTINITDN